MKNNRTIFIRFKSVEDLKEDLLEAFYKGRKSIQQRNVVYFDTPTSFRNFLTLQKIELLTLISHVKPNSIYELAKISGRPLAAVQRDCQVLAEIGFIKLIKQKTGRGSLAPQLSFNYNKITVELSEHPYELQFKEAM